MTHHEFRDFVVQTLGEKVKEQGATLYSSFDTLKKGKLYILGLNPGGSHGLTIEDSLERIKDPNYNEYTMEWERHKAGDHPLQRNIKAITDQFKLDIREVIASNLIFTRSIDQNGARWINRRNFWPVHAQILQIVQPEIIVAFGKGRISPYQHLRDISRNISVTDSIKGGHGKFTCVSFKGEIENQLVTVIGLPHLSRYHLYTDNPLKRDVLKWIKSKA